MRPINKLVPGQIVVLEDGTTHTVQQQYNPYQSAKGPLCANFGRYCSFCESFYLYARDLQVEHILPKDPALGYSHLEKDWDNFLLSCPTCNGKDNKSNKVAPLTDCHYPHTNNTFLSLVYQKGGVVSVNPALTALSARKAEALYHLVGLDKTPATSNPGDKRWQRRMEIWNIAERYKQRYDRGELHIDVLMDYIKVVGFWSIWFTVFDSCDEVRQRLIIDFPGTADYCFDARNHYAPIERNPGMPDPI